MHAEVHNYLFVGKGTAYELKGITELETTQPPEATRVSRENSVYCYIDLSAWHSEN